MKKLLLKTKKAFTLIELILVVVLLSILATTIPKFFRTEEYLLLTFFQESLGSVRYAQKLAVGMGCHVQVSSTDTVITLKTRDSCTSGGFNTDILDPEMNALGYQKEAPSGITIVPTNFPIYFDRAGKVYNDSGSIGDAQLQINTKIIKIIGETGYSYEHQI